jgi:hypothetical protein
LLFSRARHLAISLAYSLTFRCSSDQFDALENLSSIKITSIRADALELTILDDLKLSLICDKYKPTVKEPRLELVRPLGKRTMTEDGELLEYLFQLVEAEMRKCDGKDVKEVRSRSLSLSFA